MFAILGQTVEKTWKVTQYRYNLSFSMPGPEAALAREREWTKWWQSDDSLLPAGSCPLSTGSLSNYIGRLSPEGPRKIFKTVYWGYTKAHTKMSSQFQADPRVIHTESALSTLLLNVRTRRACSVSLYMYTLYSVYCVILSITSGICRIT